MSDNYRNTGRTTRLADDYIQMLFNTGKCQVYDHYGTRAATKRLFEIIKGRLEQEHNINGFVFNYDTLTISQTVILGK